MSASDFQCRQSAYARVAGAALLSIILSSVLSNHLVVWTDAQATAHNLIAHALQFRIGLVGELLMLNGDIVLAAAFYALLKPVGPGLALLGTFWRLTNAFLLAVGAVASFVALDALTAPHLSAALAPFGASQRPALVLLFLDLHATAMTVGLLLFSLGAATHSWLLFRSRYIPRVLSGGYFGVAVILFAGAGALLLFPRLDAMIDPWFILPDFVVELLVALWLLIRGVRIPAPRTGALA